MFSEPVRAARRLLRQRHCEGAALPWYALNPDPAAVGLYNGLADIQAQPNPFYPLMRVHASKRLKEPLDLTKIEADAVVGHADTGAPDAGCAGIFASAEAGVASG